MDALTPREAGRSHRAAVPRRQLAGLAARPETYDPVDRLIEQGRQRVASLLPLRHQRMAADPLSYFRGAALLMADDLAAGESSPIEVQVCGDAHAANFGVFSSPERRLVFDVNDFDETARAPFEWDLKRFACSLALVARARGADTERQRGLVEECATAYQQSVSRFAEQTRLEVWYAQLDVESVLAELRTFFTDAAARAVGDVVGLARSRDARTFARLVERPGPRIALDPPLLTALGEIEDGGLLSREDLIKLLDGYADSLVTDRRVLLRQFRVVDAAHLVRGVGSVGTQCYVVLLVGRDDDDIVLLQVKEAQESVLDVARATAKTPPPGERVVAGQRLMQAASDVLLGWRSVTTRAGPRSFYVRQLYDHKASVDLARLDHDQLRAYGRVCAWVLARAHARSGRSAEIAGYVGAGHMFAHSIGEYALAYRDRTVSDYLEFTRAIAQGRITASS